MTNDEHPFSGILARLDISSMEPLQMAIDVWEDDVKDLNDDDIGMEMSKQVLFKDLNPLKARLNYN